VVLTQGRARAPGHVTVAGQQADGAVSGGARVSKNTGGHGGRDASPNKLHGVRPGPGAVVAVEAIAPPQITDLLVVLTGPSNGKVWSRFGAVM
jgi:hypothetical protein